MALSYRTHIVNYLNLICYLKGIQTSGIEINFGKCIARL